MPDFPRPKQSCLTSQGFPFLISKLSFPCILIDDNGTEQVLW